MKHNRLKKNSNSGQLPKGQKKTSLKIALQLFGWALVISLILRVIDIFFNIGLSYVSIFAWLYIPPVIVSKYYIKKHHKVIPRDIRKYSSIYYMLFLCGIGAAVIIPLLMTLQSKTPLDDFNTVAASLIFFFIVFFILGSIIVYAFLRGQINENNKPGNQL